MGWENFIDLDKKPDKLALGKIKSHKEFIEKILDEGPDRFLEVGCGTGSMSYAITLFKKDSKGVAIDNNEHIISKLKLKYDIFPRLEFRKVNALNLPENWSNQFDLVFSQGLLEHFSKGEAKKNSRRKS